MATIKFGVSLSEPFDLKQAVETAQTIEALGFDSLWVTENVRSGTAELEPLIALTAFAAHTKKIQIGPGVVILPLRSPIGLAHAGATLDRLSGGRFILGVGAGGESADPFNAYGVPIQERGRRCDESLDIIKRLWTEPLVSFSGRFWSFYNYGLGLRPVQKPHPPIWMAGARAESVVQRAARFGDAIFPTRTSPENLADLFRRLDGYRKDYGRDKEPFTRAVYLRFCLSDTVEKARGIFRKTLEHRYKGTILIEDEPTGPPSGGGAFLRFNKFELVGNSNYIIANIRQWAEAGVTHMVLDMSCPADQILPQLKTFSERIMPTFK